MGERDLGLREAGNLISGSGLADDVIQTREEKITQRRGRQREEIDDADDAHDDRDEPEDDEPEDDADADGSNLDDGEPEDGEDDGADEGEADAEDDDDRERQSPEGEHTVKVDGKEFKVTTKELIAGYQRNADYHRKTQALAQRGRDLTASHGQVAQHYTQRLQQVSAIVGGVRKLLIGDVNSAEMAELQRTNPQEWMVQRTLMQDRIGRIDAVINGLTQEHERHKTGLTKEQQANLRATVEQEHALVRKGIPDWDGEGKVRLGKYLTREGFSEQELVNTVDSRMLLVAEKARKWDALQAAKGKQMQKRPKPTSGKKPLRPSATKMRRGGEQQTSRVREFERAKTQARKTGDMRDAGKAISKLL